MHAGSQESGEKKEQRVKNCKGIRSRRHTCEHCTLARGAHHLKRREYSSVELDTRG